MSRTYGRKYVIQWDTEVSRFHITLGKDSVGFHKTEDGAKAIVATHARQVTVPGAVQPYEVSIQLQP